MSAVSINPATLLRTREEAADFLRVTPQTLAHWASTGRVNLPYVKVGKFARYRQSDLEAFVNANVAGGSDSQ
jgi:predicted site-specific integrase-resolvase